MSWSHPSSVRCLTSHGAQNPSFSSPVHKAAADHLSVGKSPSTPVEKPFRVSPMTLCAGVGGALPLRWVCNTGIDYTPSALGVPSGSCNVRPGQSPP